MKLVLGSPIARAFVIPGVGRTGLSVQRLKRLHAVTWVEVARGSYKWVVELHQQGGSMHETRSR